MKETLIQDINQRRAVILAVQSIYDNPLLETWHPLKYEEPIQAGAALTEQRIARLTDIDGDDDHISARNRRYSELTAMYWAWKHLKTPYIGICHYRRKFAISEEELDQCMDEGLDVIILREEKMEHTMEHEYAEYHYIYDWYYMLELIHQKAPSFYEYIVGRQQDILHGGCMAIYKREYLEQVCQFLFPILDAFYHARPEKRDVYQRRDVGFLAERLLSLYFEYQKDNLRYKMVDLISLKSTQDMEEQSLKDENQDIAEAKRKIDEYLSKNQFTKSAILVCSLQIEDEDLKKVYNLVRIYLKERNEESETFFDYVEDISSIADMVRFYDRMVQELQELLQKGLNETNLQNMLRRNRITQTALLTIMEMEKIGVH